MAKSVLEQLVSGVEKLPGNALGGPVDLANSVLNIVRAGIGITGRETGLISKAENLPELDENPLGGSKWINSKFGLGESTGPVDSATQFVGGLVSPVKNTMTAIKAGALLKPLGAVILPAALVKGEEVTSTAQRFLSRGASPEKVFNATGVFPGLEASAPLKAVLPDTSARLQSVGGAIRTSATSGSGWTSVGGQAQTKIPAGFEGYLPDVLDHPELFKAMPSLKDVRVRAQETGGGYDRGSNTISLGATSTDEGMMSVLLHETQHAIQNKAGFEGGGNPGMFLENQNAMRLAKDAAQKAGDTATVKKLDDVFDQAYQKYLNIGGELEAQIVQYQRVKNRPETNPRTLATQQAGGEENIISKSDPAQMAPVDTDPVLKSLIKQYTGF